MIEQIQKALEEISRKEDVRVLLAVESGSRAWGFESADSDWDVRFVYVRPVAAYVSIHPRRDVIERALPGDLDVAGWDLPKALRLFAKSNPALLEWVRSPIVYCQDEAFVEALRALEPLYTSVRSGLYHYRSMAFTNYREFLQGEEVKLKKYLYVLRPILACLYLERTGSWPPVRFSDLVESDCGDAGIRAAIDELVERKRAGGELGVGPRISILNEFIEAELARLNGLSLTARSSGDVGPLDALFREQVGLRT